MVPARPHEVAHAVPRRPVVRRGQQVLGDGDVLEELQRLERPAQPGPRPSVGRPAVDALPVQGDAAGGTREPGDRVDHRRLAGPVRTDQADDLTGLHTQVDVADSDDRAIPDGQPIDLEGRGGTLGRFGFAEQFGRERFRPGCPGPASPPSAQPRHGVEVGADHPVRVLQEDQQERDPTHQHEPGCIDPLEEVRHERADASGGERRAQDRARHVTHPAEHGEGDRGDRRERVEGRLVGDGVTGERQEHSGQARDAGGHDERVQLGREDVDP
jgi:hypothetical protein